MKKSITITIILTFFVLLFMSCHDDDNNSVQPNFVVAAGFTTTKASVRYSENGIYWAPDNVRSISQSYLVNGLAYGDSTFIGVGTGLYTYQSNDGITWEQTLLDEDVTYNDIALGEYYKQTPWVPYFVAVGNGGAVMHTSSRGTAWTKDSSGVVTNLNGIAFGLTTLGFPMFVAVGNSPTFTPVGAPAQGTLIYSITAGETWVKHSSGGTTSDLYCVAFGNGRFIAAGENGKMIYSVNGATWQSVNSNSTKDIYGICYGIANNSPIWVAVGEEGATLYSQDNGNNWIEGNFDTDKTWQAVICADNRFYAVGYGGDGGYTNGVEGKIIYSSDGITWHTSAHFADYENYFRDIACKTIP